MTRKSWVQINGELVEKDSYIAEPRDSHYVIPDIQPYRSMVDGRMIQSRSAHREHLRAHGLVEVGNETKHLKSKSPAPPPGLKETLIRVAQEKLRR